VIPSVFNRCEQSGFGRHPAAGVPCSANVPRPVASSLISLRKAHHRRDEVSLSSRQAPATLPVPKAPGGSRSEIKEEAKPGDSRGGSHPVASAHTTNTSATHRIQAVGQTP
jgi:hypothetical protein